MYEIKDIKNLLGTFVLIKIFHKDQKAGLKAISEAFNEILRIQNLMSLYYEESEVSRLNRDGFIKRISEDTRYVIERAIYHSEISNGAFDITVLPVLRLWNEKRINNEIPKRKEIKERLAYVGYKNIMIEKELVGFQRSGMSITLASVAKGFAIDRAIGILRRNNINHGLINAGGDIGTIGGKGVDIPWRIGIRDPSERRKLIASVEVFDKAIATSGNYYRSYNDIIDPRKGLPSKKLISSTVICEKAIDADIISTLFFVTGIKKGIEIFKGKVKGIFVTKKGEVFNYLS